MRDEKTGGGLLFALLDDDEVTVEHILKKQNFNKEETLEAASLAISSDSSKVLTIILNTIKEPSTFDTLLFLAANKGKSRCFEKLTERASYNDLLIMPRRHLLVAVFKGENPVLIEKALNDTLNKIKEQYPDKNFNKIPLGIDITKQLIEISIENNDHNSINLLFNKTTLGKEKQLSQTDKLNFIKKALNSNSPLMVRDLINVFKLTKSDLKPLSKQLQKSNVFLPVESGLSTKNVSFRQFKKQHQQIKTNHNEELNIGQPIKSQFR